MLPPEAVLVGATAARMHGLDLRRDYQEIAVPPSRGTRSRRGLLVRHLVLPPADVVTINGVTVTSVHRTLRDICVSEPAGEALVALDMAIRCRRTTKHALREYVGSVAGLPGAKRLRRLIELAEPAESPMETRLRWLLIQAGLPRPRVQVKLGDATRFVGRADLYYPDSRLIVEYDGGNHRDRMVSDDRRQNLLVGAGYRILRFTASDLSTRPELVVAQVRGSIAA